MDGTKYIFSQVTDFLEKRIFDGIVGHYDGDKRSRYFTSWNQMLVMMFGQLAGSDSLRDLTSVINAHEKKAYHLGFGKSVKRSNLAKANEKRNCKIFEEFAVFMMGLAKAIIVPEKFPIKGKIYAFDSTTIDLCMNVFWWAKYKSTKGGIKVHTLFDTQTRIPEFIRITEAQVNDVVMMDTLEYQPKAYYIFDRAYIDFGRLYRIEEHEAFFVTRAKSNINCEVIKYVNEVDLQSGILKHEVIKLRGHYQSIKYPKLLRKILYYDKETDKYLEFLTNNFEIGSANVALLYKQRWGVELFFKWIKQHLKVKSFWGRSENAVRIQIYCAVITYCLVAVMKEKLKIKLTTYEILRILSPSLLDKTPIAQLLNESDAFSYDDRVPQQLTLQLL